MESYSQKSHIRNCKSSLTNSDTDSWVSRRQSPFSSHSVKTIESGYTYSNGGHGSADFTEHVTSPTNHSIRSRPNNIRTETHHHSKFSPNDNASNYSPVETSGAAGNGDGQSPHGSTTDSGVSSQRSSISRQNETFRERKEFAQFSHTNDNTMYYESHMRHYPQMSRSITPDTLTMTESRCDYDTASLPRTPYSGNRMIRKLPFSSTQRPLRSYSQMDVTPWSSRYSGLQQMEPQSKYMPHNFGFGDAGLVSMSKTKESLQSSQESIMTYAEGYGYGPTSNGKFALDRTSSINSDMQYPSPSSSTIPHKHHSPISGYPLHKRTLPAHPQYASSPAVNMEQAYSAERSIREHPSPKYNHVDAIAEEEEEPSPATPKKSKKPSLRVFNALVHKMTGQIKGMDDLKNGSLPKGDTPMSPSKYLSSPVRSPCIHHKQVPALMGLKNHGNTCYMNAIIQCLSNTDRLAEYFVRGKHKDDLLKVKKNKTRKFGTRGELTDCFASLLQAIWSLNYSSVHTEDFRKIVGKYAPQYKGDDQHDAQEFLIWLLDNVHEDLNSGSSKKKFKQIKNSHNKSDELLAAESQANYLRHNSSFIHDMFHAQFRSTLKCLNCGQQSSTFEPFLCVSVPIPQRTTRVLTVVVAFITGEPRVIKMALKVESCGRMAELRGEVARQCRIAVTRLVLCEVYADGFYRCFSDQQPLHDVRDQDNIYAIEIPNNSYSAMTSSQVRPYIHGVYHGQPIKEPVTLLVIHQVGYGRVGKRFGQPMAIEIDRNVNFNQLKVVLLKAMGCNRIEEVMSRNCSLRIGVCSDQNGNRSILTSQSSRPLYHHIVSSMLQFTASKGEPPHIKAVVEWKEDLTPLFSPGVVDVHVSEHEDYRRLKSTHSQPVCTTIQECLDVFTQEEKLAADNAWQCMNCRKLQQCTKKLSLWSLPDILVIHLKRFKQTTSSRHKLSTMVQFPVSGLDLSTYVEHNQNQNNQSGSQMKINLINNLTRWSQWRTASSNNRRPSISSNGQDCIYDLHAVCNHVGSLSGGHYTAYCKNSTNNKWYHFDDTKITSVSENAIVSKGAYILLYHRRSLMRPDTMGHFDHWSMYKDNLNVHPTTNQVPPTSPSHEGENSPPRQGYINGFGSLRLREVRKSKWREPKGTWNPRILHSQDSLDSGIVISNGQAEQDQHDLASRHPRNSNSKQKEVGDDGGFSTRPRVRGLSDNSGSLVQVEGYDSVPESRI